MTMDSMNKEDIVAMTTGMMEAIIRRAMDLVVVVEVIDVIMAVIVVVAVVGQKAEGLKRRSLPMILISTAEIVRKLGMI